MYKICLFWSRHEVKSPWQSSFLFARYASVSIQESMSSKLVLSHGYSQNLSYMEISQKFYDAMKDCSSLKSMPIARKLHAQLIVSGLDGAIFLQNNLLHMYCSCGSIDDAFQVFRDSNRRNVFTWNALIQGFVNLGRMREAEELFEEMPVRDSVSWTMMMAGYCQNGRPGDSIKTFASMVWICKYIRSIFLFLCNESLWLPWLH